MEIIDINTLNWVPSFTVLKSKQYVLLCIHLGVKGLSNKHNLQVYVHVYRVFAIRFFHSHFASETKYMYEPLICISDKYFF